MAGTFGLRRAFVLALGAAFVEPRPLSGAAPVRSRSSVRCAAAAPEGRSAGMARYGAAAGDDGLVRLVAYGALLSPRVLLGRDLGAVPCEGPCVVPGFRLAFRVRSSAYATLLAVGVGAAEGANAHAADGSVGLGAASLEAEGCALRLSARQLSALAAQEGGYSLKRLRVRMRSTGDPCSVPHHAIDGSALSAPPAATDGVLVDAMAFVGSASELLPTDGLPSERYLAKMRVGAEARGLSPAYQDWLRAHRTRESARASAGWPADGALAGGFLLGAAALGLSAAAIGGGADWRAPL
ncbi:hypothetical protein KFE25_007996 [Diacronema lutheri]|uniref:Gamma-glutamylcyclotransferase n=2 Tax=Diacronema lutheri TaxID=2081491 RepID=A0A8J5XMH5_DIALT|nr:hypothetical protein KFE25_007996 [Diacronema lutheri]